MRRLAACLALGSCAVLGPSAAEACRLVPPVPHALDPAEQAIDVTPPANVEVAGIAVRRGVATGCSSCDDIGQVTIRLAPTSDDRTSSADMGYFVDVSDGAPVGAGPGPIRAAAGAITLSWNDGKALVQEPIRFVVSLTAVDLAGNVSPDPTEVLVADPPQGCGCRASAAGDLFPVGMLAMLLGLLGLRRRAAWK